MSTEQRVVLTFTAATDLSTKKGYAVALNGSVDSNTPRAAICGANADAIGIILDPPTAQYKPMAVCVAGVAYAKLGSGGADEGNPLKTDSNGALVVASADKDKVVAVALDAGADTDIIRVLIRRFDISST